MRYCRIRRVVRVTIDMHGLGTKLILFLFVFALFADFGAAIMGSGLNVPSLTALSDQSASIQKNTNYIMDSVADPLGYPYNASATADQITANNAGWFSAVTDEEKEAIGLFLLFDKIAEHGIGAG